MGPNVQHVRLERVACGCGPARTSPQLASCTLARRPLSTCTSYEACAEYTTRETRVSRGPASRSLLAVLPFRPSQAQDDGKRSMLRARARHGHTACLGGLLPETTVEQLLHFVPGFHDPPSTDRQHVGENQGGHVVVSVDPPISVLRARFTGVRLGQRVEPSQRVSANGSPPYRSSSEYPRSCRSPSDRGGHPRTRESSRGRSRQSCGYWGQN